MYLTPEERFLTGELFDDGHPVLRIEQDLFRRTWQRCRSRPGRLPVRDAINHRVSRLVHMVNLDQPHGQSSTGAQ
jgi:hypothetical protein